MSVREPCVCCGSGRGRASYLLQTSSWFLPQHLMFTPSFSFGWNIVPLSCQRIQFTPCITAATCMTPRCSTWWRWLPQASPSSWKNSSEEARLADGDQTWRTGKVIVIIYIFLSRLYVHINRAHRVKDDTVSTQWKFKHYLLSTFWVTTFWQVPELQRMCGWMRKVAIQPYKFL